MTRADTRLIGEIACDSWKNAALVDTGKTEHVALLLSSDGDRRSLVVSLDDADEPQAVDDTPERRSGPLARARALERRTFGAETGASSRRRVVRALSLGEARRSASLARAKGSE